MLGSVVAVSGVRLISGAGGLCVTGGLCGTGGLHCAGGQCIFVPRRGATAWTRRKLKQEQLRQSEPQPIVTPTQPADRVYVWGNASMGALGEKKFLRPPKHVRVRSNQLIPHRFDYLKTKNIKVRHAACGYGFTVFLGQRHGKSEAFGCGINTYSQLGFQATTRSPDAYLDYVLAPIQIHLPLKYPDRTKLLDVACGRAHTVVVTDNEGMFSLGCNSHGQCGRSVIENEVYKGSHVINKIDFNEPVKQVCCGRDHTLVLTEAGHVYSCGIGILGQTGQGHYRHVDRLTPVTGDIIGEKIVHIATKVDSSLAISEKGEVFGWGDSNYKQFSSTSHEGQVNVARRLPFSNTHRVLKAALTTSLCALVNDRGEVFVWGSGIIGKGPACDGSSNPELLPPPLFGRNELHPESRVVNVMGGIHHFLAVTDGGQLYAWGKNTAGCLGLGHKIHQYHPFKVLVPGLVKSVHCGADHTVALCTDVV